VGTDAVCGDARGSRASRSHDVNSRIGALVASVYRHPAVRYLIAGTTTFLIDIGSLRFLHGFIGVGLALSTVAAFGIAFAFQFTVVRKWAFASLARDGPAHRQLVRYLVLVSLNLCSTVLIVVGLSAAGVSYLVAKVVAACLNAAGNFFAYRRWVFAPPRIL
jgi:putative flippase GtrA